MTPDQRQKILSHKSSFPVFLANTFLPDVAFSVPDGDRSVQAAQNPAVKQRSHLLLSLPGGLYIIYSGDDSDVYDTMLCHHALQMLT